MKIKLEDLKGLEIGGSMIEINTDEDMDYDEELQLLDSDGDPILDTEEPVLSFVGKNGERYVVSLSSVSAFRVRP